MHKIKIYKHDGSIEEEDIPDLTKHGDITHLLIFGVFHDIFESCLDKWEKENPDKKIPPEFKNLMSIQFKLFREILSGNTNIRNEIKTVPQEFQKIIEENFWDLF